MPSAHSTVHLLQYRYVCRFFTLLCLAALLLCMGNGHAHAAGTYYVSPTGSDTNPGTQTSPFATIQHAATVVTAGDTVDVLPGTYKFTGTLAIPLSASGTAAAHTQFVSTPRGGAKVFTTRADRTWEIDGSYIDITGFDISNPAKSGRLGIINYGSYNTMAENHIHDVAINFTGCATSGGGGAIDDADYTQVGNQELGNLITHTGFTPSGPCNNIHGIYHANQYGTIANNIVVDTSSAGIKVGHNGSHVTVSNNTIVHALWAGIELEYEVSTAYPPEDYDVVNNNIVSDSSSSRTTSCAIDENYGAMSSIGSHNSFSNNLLWSNANNCIWNENNTGGVITGTITADPLFVNNQLNGTGDYHVQAGSSAIDTGISVDAPSTDYDGMTRPQGAGFDIGAYEYVG